PGHRDVRIASFEDDAGAVVGEGRADVVADDVPADRAAERGVRQVDASVVVEDFVAGHLEARRPAGDGDAEAAGQSVDEVVADGGADDRGGLTDAVNATGALGDREPVNRHARNRHGEGVAAGRLDNGFGGPTGCATGARVDAGLSAED